MISASGSCIWLNDSLPERIFSVWIGGSVRTPSDSSFFRNPKQGAVLGRPASVVQSRNLQIVDASSNLERPGYCFLVHWISSMSSVIIDLDAYFMVYFLSICYQPTFVSIAYYVGLRLFSPFFDKLIFECPGMPVLKGSSFNASAMPWV